jgi:hypothetical protein
MLSNKESAVHALGEKADITTAHPALGESKQFKKSMKSA